MAKKPTPSSGSGRKRAASKPKAAKASRKPARAAKVSKPKRAASTSRVSRKSSTTMSAGNALKKLVESPLVADLLAVGAAAALAAIAAKSGRSVGTGNAVKAAGKAAAAAMGQRISTEVGEIRKASKAKGAPKA